MLARIVPVFEGLEGETPRFYPLRAPDDPDVAAVAETASRRTQALWRKNGIGASDDGEAEDPLMRDTPCLVGLYARGMRECALARHAHGKPIRLACDIVCNRGRLIFAGAVQDNRIREVHRIRRSSCRRKRG